MILLSDKNKRSLTDLFGLKPLISLIILDLFIFNVGLPGESLNSSAAASLKTGEFNSFRRIILTVSESIDIVEAGDRRIIPELSFDSQTGEFEILLFPIDTGDFKGKTLLMEEGAYPIRLFCAFPDTKTIILKGKTIPFEKIIGYAIIGTNQFIFDIYKNLPLDTDFLKKTVFMNSDSGVNIGVFKPENIDNFDTINRKAESIRKTTGRGLFKKAFLISLFVILFGILIFSILIFMPRLSVVIQKWLYILRKGESGAEPVDKSDLSRDAMNSAKKQKAIRQLMQEKGISYDEADLLVSISKRRKNVKV